MINKKCIVLFSGGQDSTTCLLWAIANFGHGNVNAIAFDYGQKHSIELECARDIANHLCIPLNFVDVFGVTAESALTNSSIGVNEKHSKDASLPATFTAGRNALFLTIAASKGYDIEAFDIVTGTCETDFSGYPDCRQIFISAQQVAISLALGKDVRIHTPLMYLSKAETWKLAKDLEKPVLERMRFIEPYIKNPDAIMPFHIVQSMTMTDYNGCTQMNEWGMGKLDNPASILREKGYREAKERGWI